MNLIMFGSPGAGKGTQSNMIINDFDLKQVSTGDLLRNEIKLQTNIGKKAEPIISSGGLVSDDIVNSLIEKNISYHNNFKGLIFYGYPRTIPQVYSLEKSLKIFNQKISLVISLTIEKNVILKRINGRIICTKCTKIFNIYFNPPNSKNHKCDKKYLKNRSDDNSKTILNRLETHVIKSKPVLNYYKKSGSLFEMNGNQKIDEIYNKIKGILNNIKD